MPCSATLTCPVCSQHDHADFSRAHVQLVLQGLWTACYGSHGHEILHVWFDESLQTHNGAPVSQTSSPERRPRPRLVGCKVTGDANVPANEWSFVAQVCAAMARHAHRYARRAYRAAALKSFASGALLLRYVLQWLDTHMHTEPLCIQS